MLRTGALSLFIVLLVNFPAEAQEICLKDLIEKPGLFDNQEIEVEAEVLDVFFNKEGCWINISDKTQSLGVWAERGSKIPYIEHFGSYKEKGDLIRVRGTFNASCARHLGQRDIHAKSVYIIEKGKKIKEEVPARKRKLALFWFIVGLAVFTAYLIKAFLEKSRKTSVSR